MKIFFLCLNYLCSTNDYFMLLIYLESLYFNHNCLIWETNCFLVDFILVNLLYKFQFLSGQLSQSLETFWDRSDLHNFLIMSVDDVFVQMISYSYYTQNSLEKLRISYYMPMCFYFCRLNQLFDDLVLMIKIGFAK